MKLLYNLKPKDFLKGLSAGKYIQNGMFQSMTDIDLFRDKDSYGLLIPGFKAEEKTGSTVEDQIRHFVKAGSYFYGYGDEGYLYKITSAGVPTVLDSGNESSRTGAMGLCVYRDSTGERLFYMDDSGNIGYHDFASTFNDTYKTGLESGVEHPAVVFQGVMYICNDDKVATLDGSTLTTDALTITPGFNCKDIKVFNNFLAILAIDNGKSKIFLWDGFSPNYSYEYDLPEQCFSLENYKNDLAIFGDVGGNVRLFSGGEFPVIKDGLERRVTAGGTAYKNNTLYWFDKDRIYSYGSPTAFISPLIQAPLSLRGTDAESGVTYGAIIPIDTETNQFLSGNSNDELYIWASGRYGGNCQTIELPLDGATVSKVRIYTESTATTEATAELTARIYGDGNYICGGTKYLTESMNIVDIGVCRGNLNTISLYLGLDGTSDLAIKQIEIYGE